MLDSLELPQIGAESLIENTREVVVYKDSYVPRDTDSPYFSKYIRNPALIPENRRKPEPEFTVARG